MTVMDSEVEYLTGLVKAGRNLSLSDLRKAYFAGVISGTVRPAGLLLQPITQDDYDLLSPPDPTVAYFIVDIVPT